MVIEAAGMTTYEGYADWKAWRETKFGEFDVGEDIFYTREIASRMSSEKDGSCFSLLEIGFGNGSLLGWARKQGYKVIGSEIQQSLRDRAANAGYYVVKSVDDVEMASLDVVVAMDVFEHIPYDDLIATCKSACQALKPGGYLIARFPNGDSPFGLVLQNADATHVHSIGSGKIREIMRVTGFKVDELRAPIETPVSLASKLVLPLKKAMRALFRQYVRIAFLGGSAPSTFAINYLLVARKVA